ncbi:LADA_0F13850g1_1 [Lachancea dasiensis]|uniref:ferric-chelate reductase (NADPH) n=1 Tax=Lachancea dasiensis TaxID=1072105 RepID=A0A1G4JMY7_9SACH|nr:LADA_0F13850g1_1 [Lachancea dasiensis]
MRFHNVGILLWAVLSNVCYSLVLVDSSLASACLYYDKMFEWGCGSHGMGMKAYKCRCGNINWLGTVTNCIASNTESKRLREHAFRHVAKRCYQKGDFHYSLQDMYGFWENGTQYLRDPTEADLTSPVNTAIGFDQEEFDWYYRKFKDFTFQAQRSQWFGWGVVFYWAAVMVVFTAYNVNCKYFGFRVPGKPWFTRTLVIPSVFQAFWQRSPGMRALMPGPHPNRLQGFIVTIFVIQVMISTGVGYQMELPNPYLTTRWFMNLDLVSYRTDLMSMSLFPLIYFFGIRNNPFIALTGMSYTAFSFFHKWCAYVATALAFIHSIIWTVYAIQTDGYQVWAMDAYWQYGVAAMVLMALLVIHSAKVLRDLMYELFLFAHQLLNVFFIVGMYYHCKDLGWLGWIWSMAGILVFDRVLRLGRIAMSGGPQTSTLTDCGGGIIKLTLHKPKYLAYRPGSFAYIYFFGWNDPWYYQWQSHPFTLLSLANEVGSHGENLVVYFKAHKGVTGQMLQRLLKSGKDSIQVTVMIEGPYGDVLPQTAKVEQNLVAVGAGLGITAIYAQLDHLMRAQPSEFSRKLFWVINDVNRIAWFSDHLKFLLSKGCEVTILCTNPKELECGNLSPCFDDKVLEKIEVKNLFSRPDLNSLITLEIQESSYQSRNVKFITCGPSTFNVDFRATLAAALDNQLTIDVALQEESFVW